jgi:hypothetical protein
LEDAADYLALSVKAVNNKLHLTEPAGEDGKPKPVQVVCAGGLLQNPLLFRMLNERVHAFMPSAQLIHPRVSPADGAALLARTLWNEQTQKLQQQK